MMSFMKWILSKVLCFITWDDNVSYDIKCWWEWIKAREKNIFYFMNIIFTNSSWNRIIFKLLCFIIWKDNIFYDLKRRRERIAKRASFI